MTVEEDVSNTTAMVLAEIKNMGNDIGHSLIAWYLSIFCYCL